MHACGKGVIKCLILLWPELVFKAVIIQLPAGRRNFAVNLFPGSISTKPDQQKEMDYVCFRLLEFIHPLQHNIPSLLMPLVLFCFLK